MAKTIVLGLGNLLLGDEGVGIHVVRKLEELELPLDVELVDGGTASFDLLPVLQRADRVIVVDAACAGGPPGSVYRFRLEPQTAPLEGEAPTVLSLHQLSFQEVLQAARLLAIDPEIVVIGVEPKRIEPSLDLSPEVKEALPQVIAAVQAELR